MKLVNLTQHDINVLDENDTLVRVIPPSGTYARITMSGRDAGEIDGIPFITREYGDLEFIGGDLPIADYYIVSNLVRSAVPHRHDFVSPADLVRDDKKRVIGCRALEGAA